MRRYARLRQLLCTAFFAFMVVACSAAVSPTPPEIAPFVSPAPGSALATVTPPAPSGACRPAPVVVPTAPATVPGYTEYDPSTGLHMTGTVQQIDPSTYRLQVTGKVDHPLELTYDDLRCMPKIQTDAPLVCPGFFVDHATWAGAPLANVLQLAGIQTGAKRLTLYSEDRFVTQIELDKAMSGDNIIAYEWQGEPLPIFHGFPIRAVFPSTGGSYWVKYLVKISVD